MTLHETIENTKKGSIATGIGIVAIFILYIFIKIISLIFLIVFPPVVPPPNVLFGKVPTISFPQNAVAQNFTYTINTVSGTLPNFPDRLNIYQITQPQPNLLNLDTAKQMVTTLNFTNSQGTVLPQTALGNATYEWDETNNPDLNESIKMNIVSFNFDLTSNFLTSLTVANAQYLSDQTSAIDTVQTLLKSINLLYSDIDLTKTQNPNPNDDFNTSPQLFSILNGQLSPTSSLSNAQAIRVDLYQNNIQYTLNAVLPGSRSEQQIQEDIPIIYPSPPYSTMSFWVASGDQGPEVVQANYFHQAINNPSDSTQIGVYPIITAQQAYTQLQSGDAYIAAYNGTDNNILINKIYLAYYMGDTDQQYLLPVYVFEGANGFFAYIPAISGKETQ